MRCLRKKYPPIAVNETTDVTTTIVIIKELSLFTKEIIGVVEIFEKVPFDLLNVSELASAHASKRYEVGSCFKTILL